jgi:hypothetical protein
MSTGFSFGKIRSTQKTTLKEEKKEALLKEHFVAGEPYYLFVTDEAVIKTHLQLLVKDIENAGIKSYIIVSSITTATPKKDATVDLLSLESNWKQYVTFNETPCQCIVTFGSALRILNRCADVNYYDFMDDLFYNPRYWCGSEFVNGPNRWVYPVAPVGDIYPIALSADFANMHTFFFRDKLQRIKNDDMSTDDLDMRDYEIIVPADKDATSAVLKLLVNSELLSYDCETSGFDFLVDKLGTIQLCNDGVKAYVLDWKNVDRRLLKPVFTTAKRIVGANAKFDTKFIHHNGVTGWWPTDDIALLAHAINSDRPKGLKAQTIFECGRFTGYDNELDIAKKKFNVENYLQIPRAILNKYAGIDAIVTWRVLRAQEKRCAYIDKRYPNEKVPEWTIWRWYKDVMIPNANVVTEVELEGVYFDPKDFDISEKKILDHITELKEQLAAIWKVKPTFQFESTLELGNLFKSMGWPEIATSKAGGYKTSDEVLTEYERQNMPGIKILKELRSYNVARGTFIDGWKQFLRQHPDGTWRIHPNCNTFGTASFRHAMTSPNFQQIPSGSVIAKYIKGLFKVPPNESCRSYTVTDDDGHVWNGLASDLIQTAHGPVRFDELKEDDVIISSLSQ